MSDAGLTVNLKSIRQSAGLTQMQLAMKVGVSRKTINTVENTIAVPSTRLALGIARALSVSVEDLFRLNERSYRGREDATEGRNR